MMQKATIILYILLLISSGSRCFASGYQGDMGDAWKCSSIVVLGRLYMVGALGRALEQHRVTYVIDIEKTYKGTKTEGKIEFLDLHSHSTASLYLLDDARYLVFIQTREDREQHFTNGEGIGTSLTGLRAFKVDDTNLNEVEAGMDTVKTYYEVLSPGDRNKFLLENLSRENVYTRSFIVREILRAKIREAVPHFQQKLSQAKDEKEKLNLVANLRCLGENVRGTLLLWLDDDSFLKKPQVIEELVRLHDKSVVPEIRKYVNAKDEYLAVTARSALLRLGESDAKKLLLDMISRSKDKGIRYNAIHPLHWNYSGEFTDEEKAMISELVNDEDENIARVAGFIVAKWKPISNK